MDFVDEFIMMTGRLSVPAASREFINALGAKFARCKSDSDACDLVVANRLRHPLHETPLQFAVEARRRARRLAH